MKPSYFTPSNNSPEFLESIFTARERLAARLVSRILDSVQTGNRHYMLLIGPRGIGKSHLVTLIYNRVKNDPYLAGEVRIAWLNEDPYAADSYAGLLRAVLVQLDKEYGIPEWGEKLAAIQDIGKLGAIERALEAALLDFVRPRMLLLIAENLDTIFDNLQDTGQKKLRAFLQTKNLATVLATSPSLIRAAEARERPFFGFFRNDTLCPLTLRDCIDMLLRLANTQHDHALAEMLSSPVGQARIRAIHHLAGGNPRIYVIFYQFLTCDSLDALVEPFMDLVNELVPYYQSRMQTLTAPQRRLVDTLRQHESPVAVADIAKSVFDHPELASDLKRLLELGYLTAIKVGRESLYELREPLMRICLANKEHRGETLPLFVEFLRAWCTPAELKGFGDMAQRRVPEYERHGPAIKKAIQQQEARIASDLDRALSYRVEGLDEAAAALLLDLFERAPDDLDIWWPLFATLVEQERYPELIDRARELILRQPDLAAIWNCLTYLHYLLGNYEAAFDASTRAIELAPDVPSYLQNHLHNLEVTGRFVERRTFAGQILATSDRTALTDAAQLVATCHEILGDRRTAVAVLVEELRKGRAPYEGWRRLHILLENEEADQARLRLSEFATTLFPDDPVVWRDHSTALSANGLRREALAALDKAIAMAPDNLDFECEHLPWCVLAGDLAGARAAAAKAELAVARRAQGNEIVLFGLAVLHCIDGDEARSRELLRRYLQQVAKDGYDLRNSLALSPLLLTRDPATLARIVALWVDAYTEVKALPALGRALAGSIICPPTLSDYGIDEAALTQWRLAWQPFETLPELALPASLMEVALRFRETHDDAVLLALPVEQREMLRPQVERFKRWLGLATHELDAEVDGLIDAVLSRTSSVSPRMRKPLDLAALLQDYTPVSRDGDPLAHLVKGEWLALSREEAHVLLAHPACDAVLRDSWAGPETVRVLAVDAVALPFSPARLYQVNLDIGGRSAAIDLLADDDDAAILDGSDIGIQLLFASPERSTTAPEAESAFVRFACNARHTANGRFRILDGEPGLRETIAALLPGVDLPLPRTVEEDGRIVYEELLVYGDTLFQVRLRRGVEADSGKVEMLSDNELVSGPLGLRAEDFIGNLRLWKSATDANTAS